MFINNCVIASFCKDFIVLVSLSIPSTNSLTILFSKNNGTNGDFIEFGNLVTLGSLNVCLIAWFIIRNCFCSLFSSLDGINILSNTGRYNILCILSVEFGQLIYLSSISIPLLISPSNRAPSLNTVR